MGNSVGVLEKKKLAKKERDRQRKPKAYRLVYFNLKGRAENSRMLLALGGVPYEDVRVTHEEWPTSSHKKSAPFGQLPILDVDGTLICQQHAIERHLARELGLYGQTSMDQTKVDTLVECIRDSMAPIVSIYNEKDDMKKMETMKNFTEEGGGAGTLPFFIGFLRNNLVGPWYLGHQISLADIALYNCFEYLQMFAPTFMDSEPTLKEWSSRFSTHAPVADWLSRRPITM